MRVKFLGNVEKRKKGCPVCGRRKSEYTYRSHRSFILPSGMTKTFRVGYAVDVMDIDGEFLLGCTYTDPHGELKHMFEVV